MNRVMKIGKIEIINHIDPYQGKGYCFLNDGEGGFFTEAEFEEMLKEILYKYF
jgi:hypothetical protein